VSPRRAVFLDRDGVINALVPDPQTGNPESPLRAADVALLSGVAEAMGRLAAAGFLLICASNQPAAAKGTTSQAELIDVQARVVALLEAENAHFDDFCICWHHPDASVAALRAQCECRKPAPGMLLDAARTHDVDLSASWMVGDSDADVLAGSRAGAATVLIEHPPSAHRRAGAGSPTLIATDLPAAVSALLVYVGC
jgi:D-glycero-D-manno-heptose 1,7-bisphosphate phosphatase